MRASERRKVLNGVSLCADPAREPCFVVAEHESGMVEFDDFSTAAGRRERLHRHMNNEIGALEIAAQCLVDFPEAPWDLQMQLARQASDESRHVEGLCRRLRALNRGHRLPPSEIRRSMAVAWCASCPSPRRYASRMRGST